MAMDRGDFQSTGGNLAVLSNIIKIDMDDRIYEFDPNVNPLILLMRKLGKASPAMSFKHEWLEYESPALYTQINQAGGYTAGSTSLVVDDGSIIGVNDLIYNQRTFEVYHVTAVSTNTLTVVRSWGTVNAATINDNDYVTVLGGAALEGAVSELGRVQDEVAKFNYIQDVRDPYGLTDILQNGANYGGDILKRKRKQRMDDHKKKIEMALFFGERQTNTGGDERRSSVGGLREFITTNATDFGGALTLGEIINDAQSQGRYTKGVVNLHCAPAVRSNIGMLAEPVLRKVDSASSFGINMKRLEAQHLDYNLITEWLFEGGENAELAFSLDMNNLKYVPYNKLDTHLRRNVLDSPSATAFKEEWRTVFTMKRIIEKSHSKWTNAA